MGDGTCLGPRSWAARLLGGRGQCSSGHLLFCKVVGRIVAGLGPGCPESETGEEGLRLPKLIVFRVDGCFWLKVEGITFCLILRVGAGE